MPIRDRLQHGPVDGVRVGRFGRSINTTFVLYRWGDTLIDAGPPNQWKDVAKFTAEKPPRQVILTHHHEDHAGNAARLAKKYNLTPYAPVEGRDKLARGYAVPMIQRLIWGAPRPVETAPYPDDIRTDDGTRIVPVFTPGHAKDLHVLHIPEKGWLFSGDLYIARSIRYLRSDEDLPLLMDSIRKALTLDFDFIFCPHRGLVENGKEMLRQKLANMVSLCEQAQALQTEGAALEEITKRLLGPEDGMSKASRYNFSKRNLIAGALDVTDLSTSN